VEPTQPPVWLADVPAWLLNDHPLFRRGLPIRWRLLYRLRHSGIDLTDLTVCWPWPGACNQHGYPRIASDPEGDTYAHRVMYRECIGPIPAGLDVEHTCHSDDLTCLAGDSCPHRRCMNPTHLEAVTRAENHRRRRTDVRGALCKNGHVFEPLRDGTRTCHQCHLDYHREYNRAYRARRAAEGRPLK
jgi:hypothetical protein